MINNILGDSSEDKPPLNKNDFASKMCNIKEDSLFSRLSLVSIDRRWTILFRGSGDKSKFMVIPSIGNMFCR